MSREERELESGERSQPYLGNMFRNCFTSGGNGVQKKEEKTEDPRWRVERGKEKIKMFRRSLVREPSFVRRAASCPAAE